MLKNFSVNTRLMLLVAMMSLVSIVLGLSGLRGLHQSIKSFEFVYEDHLVHLRDLKVIADMYAVNIVDTAHKARNGNIPWEEAQKNLVTARKTIIEKWAAHPADEMVGEEKKLIAGIEAAFVTVDVELDKLSGIFEKKDMEALSDFTINTLYPTIDPISEMFSTFIEVQLSEAKVEYDKAEAAYEFNSRLSVGMILAGVILGIWSGLSIVRSVTRPLERMRTTVGLIETTGVFSHRVENDSNDEVGQTAQAINRMLDSQQAAIGDVNRVVDALAGGNFDLRIQADLRGDLGSMKAAVNSAADAIHATMQSLSTAMAALENGDFSARVESNAQGDYRRTIEQASHAMQALREMLGEVGQVMGEVARGNLSQRISATGRGDLDVLKTNINSSLVALTGAMSTIHNNTRQVAAASNQTSQAIGQISDGAQNQTHAISQLAAAVRQTTTSVTDVSRNTVVASQKSQESMVIMRDGMKQMELMVEVVSSIAANSEKINKITEVIEKIANKTNLLSLNAAIEAARAGEHGKGFSVVAEEVGKLAANSAESSQEIARLVQQAVQETSRAVATVKQVNQGMMQIEQGAHETDSMLQRISAALEQQSSAVEEINANLTSLDKIARSNASASEEMTATVVELSRIADATRREVDKFMV